MKPYVICHMCTTLDGRILVDRWGTLPGHKTGASLFETTAATFKIPAWLVGTTTMKEFAGHAQKLPSGGPRIPREDFIANPRPKGFAIGADAKGVLRFQESEVQGDHVILLVTERVSNGYLAHLRLAGVSYLFCGAREVDLAQALEKLHRHFGLKKLMLQGGGTFNGAMLKAGLVDEVSQIIVPVVDGGVGITGVFDVPGKPPAKAVAKLRLKRHRSLPGGAQWLQYQVTR